MTDSEQALQIVARTLNGGHHVLTNESLEQIARHPKARQREYFSYRMACCDGVRNCTRAR